MRCVLLLCLCAGVGVCGRLVIHSSPVSQALAERVQCGPGTLVDFANLAPFAWDRMYVFGPYTPHEHIHHSLGFHWEEVESSSIASSDTVNLVVLVGGGKVVHWFEHSRSQGELYELANSSGFARADARFFVRPAGGDGRLMLTQQGKHKIW